MVRTRVFGSLFLCSFAIFAQDTPQDAENCKDSPIVSRFPGGHIATCDHKEYDEINPRVGTNKEGEAINKTLGGEYWTWSYNTRDGISDIQVFRNFETAIRRAGFTIDWSETPSAITGHKGDLWYVLENHGAFYYQTILTVKAMQQEVTVDASKLQDEISKSGHVAIYGINFDTGKAAILPDSEPVLAEVQKLLEQNESLKIRIEGHTDSVGQKAANQALSERRAQAVMGWLISHGIDAGRLSAKGFGDSKPVTDNATDEGRAKNRRVELAKI
jgi:outer membrane protein OmpA-like peptidoglycan-associated protein